MRACLIRSLIKQIAGIDEPGKRPGFYRHDIDPKTLRDPSVHPPPLNECEQRFKDGEHPSAQCGYQECPYALYGDGVLDDLPPDVA